MEIWIFFYSPMKGVVDLNTSPFINEMEERVLFKNHKIYFCCLLYFSLVVTSLNLNICIKEKKK